MAGKGPEAYHSQFKNPNTVRQDIKLDFRPKEEISRTEKLTRISKKVSKVQLVGWGAVGAVGVHAS